MLLTKEVEITLHNTKIKHYEDKGYYIPRYRNKDGKFQVKRGTTIVVKIDDLTDGSNVDVDCLCDGCGKTYKIPYEKYINKNHDGKTYCKECFSKYLISGENHWNWNNGKTHDERERQRKIDGYTDFIKRVLSRDNYTCQCCGKHNNLEVHHLDGYDWCKEKRVDDTNGITLCENCHSSFHSMNGYGDNTREQFEEWFGKTLEILKYDCEIICAKLIICLETQEINNVNYFVEKHKNQDTRIYRCCNKKEKTAKGKHYLWYDDYIKMSESDINKYLKWSLSDNCKAVICLNTKEIFFKMTDALNKYNIHSHSLLTKCCNGKNNYVGIHPITMEKLKWMYLTDYLNDKTI